MLRQFGEAHLRHPRPWSSPKVDHDVNEEKGNSYLVTFYGLLGKETHNNGEVSHLDGQEFFLVL
jgi:hypothetical protein